MYHFSLRAIGQFFGQLPVAIATTLWLSLLTILLSSAIGVIGALCRRSHSLILRFLSTAYVEVLRNIPLLVVIYLVYFGLAQVCLRINNFNSMLIALTLNAGAYMTEIVRAGLIATPRGQYVAGLSQGMSDLQLYRYVILPQVVRVIYAPLGNLFIGIIIGSSLSAVIGVEDLANWMFQVGNASFRYMESFLVAGVIYVALAQGVNVGRVMIGRLLMRSPHGMARHR
jgi:His/Glu/Gln/Arg/opine family amino acid ABC transporter permease subunit